MDQLEYFSEELTNHLSSFKRLNNFTLKVCFATDEVDVIDGEEFEIPYKICKTLPVLLKNIKIEFKIPPY